jgi:hypothetical protein
VVAVDGSTEAVNNNAAATGKAAASAEGLGGSIGKAVLGYMSFNAILGKVGEALQWTREQTEEAMASFAGMSSARSRLAQIADPGSGRSLDALEARADELAMKYGEGRDKVAEALFSAVSEGFEGSLESLVKYGDIVDLKAAAGVAGQVPGLFKGSGLKPEEAVSTTLLAARQSRLSFEDIASAMPSIAQGAALTGSTPTEAMGILSVMSSTFQSGAEAATKFKGLATKFSISGDEFAGKGILGGVESLMGMDEAARREFLGESQELNVAYQTLVANLPEVRKRIGEIDEELATLRAGGAGVLERQYQEFFGSGTAGAERRLALEGQRQAEIAREIANERQLALTGMQTQTEIDRALTEMKDRGEATFGQYATEQLGQGAQALGAGQRGTEVATELARQIFGGADSNLTWLMRQGAVGMVYRAAEVAGDKRADAGLGDGDSKTAKEQLTVLQHMAEGIKTIAEQPPMLRVVGGF